jgi:HTH-type transcriptional regulator/antitoxin MqsA
VDLPGWYPDGDGDGLHDPADMRALDRVLNRLKAEAEGLPTADDVRRVRRRLRLSQRRAGELLGGGPRAFQKYEAGDVLVSRPMANLLKLLDADPSLIARLGDQHAA